jgi:hypothetical protein
MSVISRVHTFYWLIDFCFDDTASIECCNSAVALKALAEVDRSGIFLICSGSVPKEAAHRVAAKSGIGRPDGPKMPGTPREVCALTTR